MQWIKKEGDSEESPQKSDVSDVALNARICSTQTLSGRSHSRVSDSRAITKTSLGYRNPNGISGASTAVTSSYRNSHDMLPQLV
jgi:hypothetical protein